MNHSTLWKWERRILDAGLAVPGEREDIAPEALGALFRALACVPRAGRPCKYPLSENQALVLRAHVLARSTQDATHFALAVEDFAHDPVCTAELREIIRAELDRAARAGSMPNWPASIRRAGMPTLQESAWFRGPKHSLEVEFTDRRGCFWVDESGRKNRLEPHTIWEADDASDNEPRRSTDPDTGQPILTRQALWTQDVYSAALLGLTQVARERDAYRIEDVADHMLNCVLAEGLPKFMRLEMGDIWNGRFFHGFVPTEPGTTHVVPGWPEDQRWGGLEPLCKIVNVHKSKGKGGIESSFNLLQAIAAHSSLSIGRSRGEFEEATRALIRSHRAQDIDERFWTMDRSPEVMRAAAGRFNLRPKWRAMFGARRAPADLLRGAKGLPLLPSEIWRFSPVKRSATVRGGHAEVSVEHYPRPFRFRVNGVHDGLHLDHGYRVLLAFHPGRPHEGCWIFNCECGVRNRDGFKRAEKILHAPHADDVPQIDLSHAGGFGPRRKANAAVRRSFRAIQSAVRQDYAQDSNGRELTVTDNGPSRTVASHAPQNGSVVAEPPPPAPPKRFAAASRPDNSEFRRLFD
jgi:hypothetical protein